MRWLLFSLFWTTFVACAADGDLDTSFGSSGSIVLAPADASLRAFSVGVENDGNLVVGGSRWAFNQTTGQDQTAVWRFLPTGAPDPNFGGGGISTIAFNAGIPTIYATVSLPDGSILAAGNFGAFGVAHLLADGSIDTLFGTNGIAKVDFTDLGLQYASAFAVGVDIQGRILLGGGANVIDSATNYWYAGIAVRLLPSGAPDPNFGAGGRVVLKLGSSANPTRTAFLGIAGDDTQRVWLSGHTNATASPTVTSFLASRLDSSGNFDLSFASNGMIAANFAANSDDWGNNAVLDHSRWTIGGTCASATGNGALCLFRLTENGTPDSSYGNQGWAATTLANGVMRPGTLACQTDGKCLVLSTAPASSSTLSRQFVVTRMDASGLSDPQFGAAGIAHVNVPISGDGGHVSARAITFQGGRPILVGTTDGTPYVYGLLATRLDNDLIFSAHFD